MFIVDDVGRNGNRLTYQRVEGPMITCDYWRAAAETDILMYLGCR